MSNINKPVIRIINLLLGSESVCFDTIIHVEQSFCQQKKPSFSLMLKNRQTYFKNRLKILLNSSVAAVELCFDLSLF